MAKIVRTLTRPGLAFAGVLVLVSGVGCGDSDEPPKKSRAERLCDTFCREVAEPSGLDCYSPGNCSANCRAYFEVELCPEEFAALTSCASMTPETVTFCSTAEQVDVSNGCGSETVALYLCMNPSFCDDPARCCNYDPSRPGCT